MYILKFKKNRSKYFDKAIEFSKELGCSFDGETVIINVPDNKLILAYATFRTLFSFIQNWKNTMATYNGKAVHPYRFILNTHRIGSCYTEHDIEKITCNTHLYGCKKIEFGIISQGKNNAYFWYNYGYFKKGKWIINKMEIKELILQYVNYNAVHICPLYKESNIIDSINQLPDFIIPDDINFSIMYNEKCIDGQKVKIPVNIFRNKINPEILPHL